MLLRPKESSVEKLPVGALLLTRRRSDTVRQVASLVGKTFPDIPRGTGAWHLVVLLLLLLF